jgi:hypothetical protein
MNITPLHAVTDTNKLATIADDMKKNGWTGNPVLIDDDESNEPKALTGSHRIAAAAIAGIDVEHYSLAETDIDLGAIFFDCNDDDDILEVIEAGSDEEAIRIMSEEVESN